MTRVELLQRIGFLEPMDVELARGLTALTGETREEVALGIALVSRESRAGHVRLDLAAIAGRPFEGADALAEEHARAPSLDALLAALRQSPLLSTETRHAPLVLVDDRHLYLKRYYDDERGLAAGLAARGTSAPPIALDPARARRDLRAMFGPWSGKPDLQRLAACLATVRRLCVVAGGPGTGKTTTVVRLLAVVLGQLLGTTQRPRALLLAPTGKAAARLGEAVGRLTAELPLEADVRACLPTEAQTLHRALASAAGPDATRRQIPADVVVVDEASMVDVSLMRQLCDALRPDARLVLLGDPDQLASVEAGAVLADVCNDAARTEIGPATAARIEEVFGESPPGAVIGGPAADDSIQSSVVVLQQSHRFGSDTAIGRFARSVRDGDVGSALDVLRQGSPHLVRHDLDPKSHPSQAFVRLVVDGYRSLVTTKDGSAALNALDAFRVLCAHRRGRSGVESTNALVEHHLARAGLVRAEGLHYRGRVLSVTHNDRTAGLYNGDVGLVAADDRERPVVLFRGPSGDVRRVSPARLPPHETAFATSIHKSQGSELDRVVILLPDASSPLASRELLYTAVTRARRDVVLFGAEDAIRACIQRRVRRASGLRELLHSAAVTTRSEPPTTPPRPDA